MSPVIQFNRSDNSIGLSVRPVRFGPENDMANQFIEKTISVLTGRKDKYAFFLEPQLETGFPDIVIVTYRPIVFDKWNIARNKLTIQDLKVLQHLLFVGGANAEGIEAMLGLTSRNLIRTLERLLNANIITWKHGKWIPMKLHSIYGLKSVIAIEAKIKNWSEAFKQAEINWWFASESYILSPNLLPQKQIIEKSSKLGIGLYSLHHRSGIVKLKISKKEQLPSSYASWLFNEWVGRRLSA
jgi:hypothetical protein